MTLAYKDEEFLVDHITIFPWGIINDVPIKVNDMLIPVDFVIIGTGEDEEIPIIFGKPFLATIRAMINDQQKELVLRTDDKEEDKEEDQEKLLVKIEMDWRDVIEKDDAKKETSNVRDEDFYRGAEPQPMQIQEQDLQQKKYPSNKAEEKSESDKVIDMICALFATIKLKRIW
ncbi:hypothetical protein A2U01_0046749, partial [Trifolium medium]|nr:hypothetical protein [Trifolium medium]